MPTSGGEKRSQDMVGWSVISKDVMEEGAEDREQRIVTEQNFFLLKDIYSIDDQLFANRGEHH